MNSLTAPWEHQSEAVDFALDKMRERKGAMLAMEMGTGKTLVALHLLSALGAKRVLILCPKSVMDVWPNEFAKHWQDKPWQVQVLDKGSIPTRMQIAKHWHGMPRSVPVALVVNYDVMSYKTAELPLRKLDWDVVICDESHRLKSPFGKQSKAVFRLASSVSYRLALTGTPMPHSPLDIYAQFRILDMGIFGSSPALFTARYGVRGGYMGHEIIGYQRLHELHQRMYQITYRCRAKDVLSLPATTDMTRYCTLEADTRAVYSELEEEMVTALNAGTVTAANALVKLLRLQQITSGYLPMDETGHIVDMGTAKRSLLAELLEDLAPFDPEEKREPVVVFARFRHDLEAIRKVALGQGIRPAELSGAKNELRLWQDGGADLLAVQLQAGGLGVDLSRARYCVYYSTDYSLGNYLQSRARIHRPGQTRAVTYIHLVARDTVDEDVIEALAKREEVVSYVVDKLAGRGLQGRLLTV